MVEKIGKSGIEFQRSTWRLPDSEGRTWLGATLLRATLADVRPGILAGIDPPIALEAPPVRAIRKAGANV